MCSSRGCLRSRCRVPDDHIAPGRYPLFMARSIMRELVNEGKAARRAGRRSPGVKAERSEPAGLGLDARRDEDAVGVRCEPTRRLAPHPDLAAKD